MKEERYPISELKKTGHALLDEYISLEWRPWKHKAGYKYRQDTYLKLSEKLGGKPHHFSDMKTKEEVLLAIAKLRKMIERRKNRIEYTVKYKEFLPREKLLEALKKK